MNSMLEVARNIEPTKPGSGIIRRQNLPKRRIEPTWDEQTFHETRRLPEIRFSVGQTFSDTRGDSFVVLGQLGEGGMGGVYKVKDKRTDLEVAVKFLNARSRGTPALVERFKREIKVLARMQNPFIVNAHDVIEVQVEDEKMVGLVMEYVEGSSLEDELMVFGPMDADRAVTIAAELAIALESLREAGIVHRDLKPANIFLQKSAISEEPDKQQPDVEREEFVRVGDFGIVSFAFDDEITDERFEDINSSVSLTKHKKIVGSPSFMSPEAATNQRVDHRSDLYLLGLVLYKMLTGENAFSGSTAQEVMMKQIKEEAPAFKDQDISNVAGWLEAIVRKLIAKNPKDRYQTAGEVFRALKDGVRADYPELLNQIPFSWDF